MEIQNVYVDIAGIRGPTGDKVTHRSQSKLLSLPLSVVRWAYLGTDDQRYLGRSSSNSADRHIYKDK